MKTTRINYIIVGALMSLCLQTHAARGAVIFTNLHTFAGGPTDGAGPRGSMAAGPNGVLYGTTAAGGSYDNCEAEGEQGCGTVFALTPPTSPGGPWSESIIWNFGGTPSDGTIPLAGVVIGANGTLYGAAAGGGGTCPGYGCGVIFSLTPPASAGGPWTENILWTFGSTGDGSGPYGLVIGAGGVLYGITNGGGTSGAGTVFLLNPPVAPGDPWTEVVLWMFGSTPADGAQPVGITLGPGGILYTVTSLGGVRTNPCPVLGCGVVASLTPPATLGAAWVESVIYNVTPAAGHPTSIVAEDDGHLYCTTGGANPRHGGWVFSLAPPKIPSGSWTEETLWKFPRTVHKAVDGDMPQSPVLLDKKTGKLFGTTYMGGIGNSGTVFSLSPPTSPGGAWTLSNIHKFAPSNAQNPFSPLIRIDGVLYGSTANDASLADGGTVFSIVL